MERYDLRNGKTFVIVRQLGVEGCKVYSFLRSARETSGEPLCSGSYSDCRRYINEQRKARKGARA